MAKSRDQVLEELSQQLQAVTQEREEERQQRLAAEERGQEDRRQRLAAEQREQEAKKSSQLTTLTEFLDFCHQFYSERILVQHNRSKSTKGDSNNAKKKLRPDFIVPWEDYSQIHKDTAKSLYELYPKTQPRSFDRQSVIETNGRNLIASRAIASETDIHINERIAVEGPVTQIVQHLLENPEICDAFKITGPIQFDNHANGLSEYNQEVSQSQQEQSPSTPAPSVSTASKIPRPKPDQFCVCRRNLKEERTEAALVTEYKPPHKLLRDHLIHVLGSGTNRIEVGDFLEEPKMPTSANPDELYDYCAKQTVAAVITQIFDYMTTTGTEYGYITTAEAYVFLHINPEEVAKTVYYHLAVPNLDVKNFERQSPIESDGLHLTAIGQVLMFTLLALQSDLMSQDQRHKFRAGLKPWTTDDDALLAKTPPTTDHKKKDSPSTRWRMPETKDPESTPVSKRTRSKVIASKDTCKPGPDFTRKDDRDPPSSRDANPSSLGTPTPSQTNASDKRGHHNGSSNNISSSSNGGRRRAFCTESCLKGLTEGNALDRHCPNVLEHCEEGYRGDRHQLNCEDFRMLLSDQLQRTRDEACEPMGIQGARGALFRVTLMSHGYTVAAKGTVLKFANDLRHEAEVYRRLTSIQGIHIPIYLGSLDLEKPFFYDAGVLIVHMMLLSWSGESLDSNQTSKDIGWQLSFSSLSKAIKAIHKAGVLHRDIRMPNILWNKVTQKVMVIDFERAEIAKTIPFLPPKMPAGKRKRILSADEVDGVEMTMDMMKEEMAARMLFASPYVC